ncbi:hypothetical protein M3Y95_01085000 [Aphelenchoides besseyi]|nr:hypothetical protein M3Y95_01085000 [Aphelenchoides besseyi]
MLGDARLFLASSPMTGIISGVFGLAPGLNSFVNQLFQMNKIPRPLLSVSGLDTKYFGNGMLVGELNEVDCTNWHQYSSVVRNGWALKSEVITFMGTKMFFNNTVLTNFVGPFFFIPTALMEMLKRDYDLRNTNPCLMTGRYCYSIPCNTTLLFEFRFGKINIQIDGSMLMTYGPIDTTSNRCGIYIDTYEDIRYAKDSQWSIGQRILDKNCLAYDYQNHQIYLGDNIS